MNQIEVKLLINTHSDDPTDWIIGAIDDNLEEDESIAFIRCMHVNPVYVRDILFTSRMDALAYCEVSGLPPTLINDKPADRKDD